MANFASNNRKQLTEIFVGRKDKMAACRYFQDQPGTKSTDVIDVEAGKTVRQSLMTNIAKEIVLVSNKFKEKGQPLNIEVFTNGQVAIKYYQMVPYLKGRRHMTTEDIEAISSERDTNADKCAYADLADAIATVIDHGNSVHLQASGNAAYLELIAPEGVALEDGQVLNFTDGVAENGITVRSWRNCNRKNVKVMARGTKRVGYYISKAEDIDNPGKSLATLLNRINDCWNKLPETETEVSLEELLG